MSFAYIRAAYGVPAKRGVRVIYRSSNATKYYCTIKSATNSGHLNVSVDDMPQNLRWKLHPTWNIEYLIFNTIKAGEL